MGLNSNALFATNPQANISRSRFDISSHHTTTFNAYEIVPVFWKECLPADTFVVDVGAAVRLQTLLAPIFSDIYLDLFAFYVPNRLLWKNWQRFLGDDPQPWFHQYDVETPQISFNAKSRTGTSCVGEKTVADYLGLPLAPSDGSGTKMFDVTHLPFRAYSRIYNEWFRSENLDSMTAFNDEDNGVTMNNISDPFYGGPCLIANKPADMWTRSLPGVLRGNEPIVGLESLAPVYAAQTDNNLSALQTDNLRFNISGGNVVTANSLHNLYGSGIHHTAAGQADQFEVKMNDAALTSSPTMRNATPSNLVADLSNASGISINELRYAFATQRYLEKLARSGNRYIEYLHSIWGVDAGDARLQRSEFLGSFRVPINVNQVVAHTQNLAEGSGADLGDVGAYSLTTTGKHLCTFNSLEHGIFMIMAVVRWKEIYQNGVDPAWLRKGVYSYYNPVFAHIGEQGVKNSTIYLSGDGSDNETFGFNEAFPEYRYSQDRVSGEMRSDISNTLDSWHLASDFSSRPSLSSEWLKGDKGVLDRVLAVQSADANQVLADFYFNIEATRAMPIRSIPGLSTL